MPLQVSTDSPAAIAKYLTTAGASKPAFLVVYASLTNGISWCGDCRNAEPLLNAKFKDGQDVVKVVYAGQRNEWRSPENPWRKPPFFVEKLPTIIKVSGDKWEQLVEEDVYDQRKLDSFVGA